MRRVLITGGYGFIGSHLVRHWLEKYPDDKVTVLDSLTYAARPLYVKEYLQEHNRNVGFIRCDIRDPHQLEAELATRSTFNVVLHLAAESHVCTSIENPKLFMETNAMGTFNLLQALRRSRFQGRFIHVSTDEVFGEIKSPHLFDEFSPIAPRSPYAASKAASDHIAFSFHHTYGMDVIVTNCSNNFGPNQHEEKLIPKTIYSLVNRKPMTVYGLGTQIRDWLWVGDHCNALDVLVHKGKAGERYCIGGSNERMNLTVMQDVLTNLRVAFGRSVDLDLKHTEDRPSDDKRYAIDSSKLRSLGWVASHNYHEHLRETISWYMKEWT